MSTQRISALPSGTGTHTGTARIAYEDSNDASNTTKFLDITSLGNEFLPLAGGTMSGDIDMNINDITEIGTLLFKNIGTGANPSLFSNTDGARELSLNGDFLVQTTGKLGFGNNFFQETGFGAEFTLVASKFIINFPSVILLELISPSNTGTISSLAVFGESAIGNPVEYSDIDTIIVSNSNTLFSGGINFQTATKGVIETNIIGININDQKELFIYDNIRFNNLGSGTDPILFANSTNQTLDLTGNLDMGGNINMDINDINFQGTNHTISATTNDLLLTYNTQLVFNTSNTQSILQFKSTQQANLDFAFFDFVAQNTLAADIIYGRISAKINDSTSGVEDGSWQFLVSENGTQNIPILGMNVDSDSAVKVFNSLRIVNSSDPTLDSFFKSANGNQQLLILDGGLTLDFASQAGLGQIGTLSFQGKHPAPVANNTVIARHEYFDSNSLDQTRSYVRIESMVEDDTALSEDGGYLIQVRTAGTLSAYININANGSGLTQFNKPIDLAGNDIDNIDFADYDVIADPGNPAASHGRVYAKVIDGTNDGLFIRIKKNNIFTAVALVFLVTLIVRFLKNFGII